MLLVKNLQKSFAKSDLLLTSTFFASVDFIAKSKSSSVIANASANFNFAKFSMHHNFFHLMPVNYKKYYTINETIYELHIQNVKQKVNDLIDAGVPAAKIVLGVTFGGPLFNSAKFQKILNYNIICEKLTSAEIKRNYSNVSALTILAANEGQTNETIIFEGSRSIANRMRFVVERGLAGAAVITMDMDCFRGNCLLDNDTFEDFDRDVNVWSGNYSVFPLIKTVNNAIVFALNEANDS